MAKPKMTDNDIAAVVAAAVLGERERCAKLVPTNWCDSLLTGTDAPKVPLIWFSTVNSPASACVSS